MSGTPDRPVWGDVRIRPVAEREFDILIVVSRDGKVRFMSASATRIFGTDANEAIDRDLFDLFDDEGGTIRASFEDLVARRRLIASWTLRTTRGDGTLADLEAVATNHLEDPVGGIVVNIRDVTEQARIGDQVRDAERRQSVIIDSMVDGVMMVDEHGVIAYVNEAFETMFGTAAAELVGERFTDVLARSRDSGGETVDGEGRQVPIEDHPVLRSLATGRRYTGIVHGIRHGGEAPVWIRINSQAILDGEGHRPVGAVASFGDITEGRQAASELRQEQRFLQVLLGNLEEGIVACDAQGRMTIFNPAARRLHGIPEGVDPVGKSPSARGLRHMDGSPMATWENPLVRALSGEHLRDAEMILEDRSGVRRLVSVNGQVLLDDDGRKLGAVVAIHDVTERKQNEDRLAELAMHDPLTGLANRTLLADRLRDAIARLAPAVEREQIEDREAESVLSVAVFLLDLDDFKEVNDAFGHDVGDDVLVAVARRLSAIVRPSDTVARLGGDEFVVVCEIKRGESEMQRIAERISSALAEPYRIVDRTLTVVASVGGVLAQDQSIDPSKVLSGADDAMYSIKWERRRERRSATR